LLARGASPSFAARLALVVGGKPSSKEWGVAGQFIGLYRLALTEAGILKADNTIAEPADEKRR
jgi:hypothetical protein